MNNLNIKRYFNLKLLFLVIGIIILGEVIWGINKLMTPVYKPSVAKSQQVGPPSIVLAAATKTYKVGETIPLTIGLSTAESFTDGADVVLKFDQNILEASPAGFIKGKIYTDYPQVSVDNKTGLVSISGITSFANGYLGTGVFGVLNFKAKKQGVSQVEVVFNPGETTNSNITQSKTAKNILEKVYNVSIKVSN